MNQLFIVQKEININDWNDKDRMINGFIPVS